MNTTIALETFVLLLAPVVLAGDRTGCATIQRGNITDSAGKPVQTGYDQWGYNYQAMMFNGFYANYTRPPVPATSGDNLMMKWNDAWLSNKDCDGDGKLDRHYGYAAYKGSGAWLTNHQSATYEVEGKTFHWTYFVKIVAVPADAVLTNGTWFSANGIEIGPSIWGEFAVIQEVSDDDGAGVHGIFYKSPAAPGLGVYKP